MKKERKIPHRPSDRTRVVGRVATQVVAKKLVAQSKGIFLGQEDRRALQERTRTEIAELIFSGLSQLRGTALKIAQVFCAETGLLPDQYMKVLEQSHYRVSPMSSAMVRAVIRRELNGQPEELFAAFEFQAAAAASLGQVHRARLFDGREVAVKVQYPGIADAIDTDLKLARLALKPLANSGLLLLLLSQFEKRLRQETNYQLEFAHLNEFRVLLNGLNILIPEPIADLSTVTVLTMEWLDGQHLDQWIASKPNQDRIDQVADQLFRWFMTSVFTWRRLHCDPNLGNFIIDQTDRVGILDFGAVHGIDDSDLQLFSLLWRSPISEPGVFTEAYRERGAKESGDLFDSAIKPYLLWVHEFLDAGSFDFSKSPDYARRGHELFTAQLFNPDFNEFRSELTFVHRTWLGLVTLFQRMGARIKLSR